MKMAIDGLGANKSKNVILRVGKAIGSLATVTQLVDRGIGINEPSGRHSEKSMAKDLAKIIEQLLPQDIYSPTSLFICSI